MSVEVVVIGAGGFGRETLDVVEAHNAAIKRQPSSEPNLQVSGIADDLPSQENLKRLESRGYRYLGTTDQVIDNLPPQKFILAIGDPKTKAVVDHKFVHAGWKATTVVHPAATVGSQCVLAEGNIICSGAQISTNTEFGRHVHVNPNATIGHDTVLEDYVSVNPGAVISGEVIVKRGSLVGAASVILQGLEIGEASIVGASACVTRNVMSSATVMGVPAK